MPSLYRATLAFQIDWADNDYGHAQSDVTDDVLQKEIFTGAGIGSAYDEIATSVATGRVILSNPTGKYSSESPNAFDAARATC